MEFYHVLNRGVQKSDIVKDDFDRLRFVHSLFIFNDSNYTNPNHRLKNYSKSAKERNELVYIHAWCLMDNHYHLLLSPVDDDLTKISLFMKKLNMGYAKYFNEKYNRSGYLWQGKYKKIHIERNAHFIYIPYYIHLNPLDYSMPEWRKGLVKNLLAAEKFLSKYRWSSHLDYSGESNFPSVIYSENLSKILETPNDYKKSIGKVLNSTDIVSGSEKIE